MYATWILPSKLDSVVLTKIINELSKEFNSQKFLPHITVYGLVKIPLNELESIVLKCVKKQKSFNVKVNYINHSENYWKSIFVDIIQNENLYQINQSLMKSLSRYSDYNFKPHISLYYGVLDEALKLRIIKEKTVQRELSINKIGIMRFSQDVSRWKIVRSLNLC